MYFGYKYDPRPCNQKTISSITLSVHRHFFYFRLFRRVLAFELGRIDFDLRQEVKLVMAACVLRISVYIFMTL